MANYPKTGQVVARYTGEWPCTRDPYKPAGVPIRQLIRIPSGVPADTGNPARRLSAGTGRSGHSGGLPDSPDECQWCGKPDRLREVLRASIEHPLPAVGAFREGLFEALPPRVDAVCPIGAGDALSAAYTWAMERKNNAVEALRWGVAAGTASARLPGMTFANLAQTREIYQQVELRRSE